jgi:hypothetical protein
MKNLIGKNMSLSDWHNIKGSYATGVVYLCTGGDYYLQAGVFITGKKYEANGEGIVDEYDRGSNTSSCVTGDVYFTLVSLGGSEPKEIPIFTQEMYLHSILPEVGMKCLIHHKTHSKNSYNIVVIIAITSEYLIVSHDGEELEQHYHLVDIEFKPLKITTSLIDGEAYQFENHQLTVKGIYCEEDKVFYTHQGLHQLCSCSNIKPLTLGNK